MFGRWGLREEPSFGRGRYELDRAPAEQTLMIGCGHRQSDSS
jgi:hypothetical protein